MSDPLRIDGHKLDLHPHRVAQWLDSGNDWNLAKKVYPLYVELTPAGACNHRCSFCAVAYLGYRPVLLDAAMLHDRLQEMSALGVKSVMMAGEGEPLLAKKINEMVLSAKLAGIDVAFTTNGVLLDKLETLSACSWIKVSINAGTRETYAKVHQTDPKDFDRVIANLRAAVQRKGDCDIGIQMVLLPENSHELPILQALGEEIGVGYVVAKNFSQHKKAPPSEYAGWKPVNLPKSYGKLVVREEGFKTEQHPYEKCNSTPFFWAYVMATGEVYSCSAYLGDDRFRLGNINTESFQSIWEGERRRANWEFVRKELSIHECRVNCRMDRANRYLAEFGTVRNAAFI